jgi:hypothetical protein
MAGYFAKVPLAGYVELFIDTDHQPGTPEFQTALFDLIYAQMEQAGPLFPKGSDIVESWSVDPYRKIAEGNYVQVACTPRPPGPVPGVRPDRRGSQEDGVGQLPRRGRPTRPVGGVVDRRRFGSHPPPRRHAPGDGRPVVISPNMPTDQILFLDWQQWSDIQALRAEMAKVFDRAPLAGPP